ncbi:DUF1996 domain-containing protein [Deinococcus sp. Arct2-2]|nr:DUF1996 domain-containing protein [Deinococcus sp. Arct2-2]
MNMDGTSLTIQALGDCATLGSVNLAQGRVAAASSLQSLEFKARNAFDGTDTTRWSSLANTDPQWIQVNLGRVQTVCGLTVQWEGAYAKAFRIEVSNDAVTWTQIYSTATGTGGTQTIKPTVTASGQYLRLTGTVRGSPYGYSLLDMKVFGPSGSGPATSGAGWVDAPQPVTGVTSSTAKPTPTGHHEFQANCSVSRSNLSDDPIKFFAQPGASHLHTFLGNTTTNAGTTLSSLQAGGGSCTAPDDRSAYWMPTMLNGDTPVQPVGTQVIYYKAGVTDYTSVRPFPAGLRFIVGDMNATREEFLAESVVGWECGDKTGLSDFPASCAAGSQLNLRYQAPSCWDGLHLDSPDHQRHMAYPVGSTQDNGVCPASHPIAVPKIEFKMAFPAGSDTSRVRLSSGRGYSFHYDFFNAWDPATLKALVDGCIRKGFQCSAQGADLYHPEVKPVLGSDYRLH